MTSPISQAAAGIMHQARKHWPAGLGYCYPTKRKKKAVLAIVRGRNERMRVKDREQGPHNQSFDHGRVVPWRMCAGRDRKVRMAECHKHSDSPW